jgi:hypothetical protein
LLAAQVQVQTVGQAEEEEEALFLIVLFQLLPTLVFQSV